MSLTVNNRVLMLLDAIKENKKHSNRNAQAKEAAARERLEPLAKVPFEATTQEAIDVLNYELNFHTTGKKYARDEIRETLSVLKMKLHNEKERAWKEISRRDRAELDAIGEKALNAKITLEQIADYKKSYEWNHTPAEAVGYKRTPRTVKTERTGTNVFVSFSEKYGKDDSDLPRARIFHAAAGRQAAKLQNIKHAIDVLNDHNRRAIVRNQRGDGCPIAGVFGAGTFKAFYRAAEMIEAGEL